MIDSFFTILRKLVVGSVTLIFAFVIVYTPQPFNETRGALAFADPDADLPGIVPLVALETAERTQETLLNGIVWSIAKSVLSMMQAELVDWINSGFAGEPAFIKNLDQFLLEAGDQAAGAYIESLGEVGSFLCSPFKLDIQIALATEYEAIRENRPYRGCTLSGVFENYEDFVAGNFKKGGWQDWLRITSEPNKYTEFGQLLEARQGLQESILREQNRETTKANWGDGFLSGKTCQTIQGINGPVNRCVISKPGKIIGDSLVKSLGAGQDTLITADEINEIITALFTQLANKALTGTAGLLGLSSGTGYTYDGFTGGSYTNAMAAEAAGGGSTDGIERIQDMLNVQNDYYDLAMTSAPVLLAYSNNPRNPETKRDAARRGYNEALAVQREAPGFIDTLTDMNSAYLALESEFNAGGTTNARKLEIRQEQLEIINALANVGAYTEAELETSRLSWNPDYF